MADIENIADFIQLIGMGPFKYFPMKEQQREEEKAEKEREKAVEEEKAKEVELLSLLYPPGAGELIGMQVTPPPMGLPKMISEFFHAAPTDIQEGVADQMGIQPSDIPTQFLDKPFKVSPEGYISELHGGGKFDIPEGAATEEFYAPGRPMTPTAQAIMDVYGESDPGRVIQYFLDTGGFGAQYEQEEVADIYDPTQMKSLLASPELIPLYEGVPGYEAEIERYGGMTPEERGGYQDVLTPPEPEPGATADLAGMNQAVFDIFNVITPMQPFESEGFLDAVLSKLHEYQGDNPESVWTSITDEHVRMIYDVEKTRMEAGTRVSYRGGPSVTTPGETPADTTADATAWFGNFTELWDGQLLQYVYRDNRTMKKYTLDELAALYEREMRSGEDMFAGETPYERRFTGVPESGAAATGTDYMYDPSYNFPETEAFWNAVAEYSAWTAGEGSEPTWWAESNEEEKNLINAAAARL